MDYVKYLQLFGNLYNELVSKNIYIYVLIHTYIYLSIYLSLSLYVLYNLFASRQFQRDHQHSLRGCHKGPE